MGMDYKSAVKIMDDVIKGYLKDYVSYTAEKMDAQRCHADQITEAYKWHADQIAKAYSRIRNG